MTDARRYRLDDLRRFASALAVAKGIAPARAAALASYFLWFDEAGIPAHGLSRLPALLERIEDGAVDPKAEGKVHTERTGSAVFDAANGIPPLALERAGELATEKARDSGVSFITVRNLGAVDTAARVVAEIAIGPMAAAVLGPGGTLAVAVPSAQGLPVVFDSGLASEPHAKTHSKPIDALFAPWISIFAPKGGSEWVVAAVAVPAIEPLASFHTRVAEAIAGLDEHAGRLLPAPWDAHRHGARAHGVSFPSGTWKPLKSCAERLGVDLPSPTAG